MPLVIVGVLLLVAKMAEFGPFATWSWWIVLAPFGLAVLWWQFADSTGWTQRRVMDKMEQRKADRRDRAMESLGIDRKRGSQVERAERAKRGATHLGSVADPTQANHTHRAPGPPPPAPPR